MATTNLVPAAHKVRVRPQADFGFWSRGWGKSKIQNAIEEVYFIFFQPGTHTETMSLAFDDFAHLVHPAIGEFSLDEVVHI